jgi:hypothetical protein
VYKFIASSQPLQGGITIIRMSQREVEKEAEYDKRRLILQQQARQLGLFQSQAQMQSKEDADQYLHARIRTCDNVGNCSYIDPSPEERERRRQLLDGINQQFGPRWEEYFVKRPFSEKERQALFRDGVDVNSEAAKQRIKEQRNRDILTLREKQYRLGVNPGVFFDDY